MSEYRGYFIGCGIVVAVFLGIAVFLFPLFVRAPLTDGHNRSCLTNIKMIATAHWIYAADNDDRFPLCTKWMDLTFNYFKDESRLHCPDLDPIKTNRYGYAMNISLSSANESKLASPDQTVLLFDSVILDRNACSNLVGLPNPPRHNGNSIAFADSHAARTDLWSKNDK